MTMRILHVLPRLDVGGVETSTVRLAYMQKRLGYEPIVVSSGGVFVDTLKAMNIQHIVAPLNTKNPLKIFWNTVGLRKIVHTTQCHMVHVHSRAPAWTVHYTLKDTQIPWVTTFHGAYGHQNNLKKTYNHIMLKGQGVIAPSQYIKDHIKTTYRDYPLVEVIYPGIDLDYFSTHHFTRDDIQQKRDFWGIQTGEMVLLLPGRLSRIKGHFIAIEALKHLRNNRLKLIIIGDGENRYLKGLQQAAASIQDQVCFFPSEDDLRLSYLASDIVLNTTIKPESFGLTVLEAQALRKPVIATDLGGPKEIIQNGISGKIISANDPSALAHAILEVFENQLMVDPQHILKFEQKCCAEQVLNFYKSIVF